MVYTWGIVWRILAIIICTHAVWRGGRDERIGAAIIFVSWVFSKLLHKTTGYGPSIGVIWVDVVTMFTVIGLSLWTRKIWTAFMAAFMVNDILCHIAGNFSPNVNLVAYITGTTFWGGYCLIFALEGGMIGLELTRWKERREHAQYN